MSKCTLACKRLGDLHLPNSYSRALMNVGREFQCFFSKADLQNVCPLHEKSLVLMFAAGLKLYTARLQSQAV